jgi:hypothetical protein
MALDKYYGLAVFLGVEEIETTPSGDTITKSEKRKTTVRFLEPTAKEMKQAEALPLQPTIKIEAWAFQYKGERLVEIDGELHTIISKRRLRKKIELTCQVGVVEDAVTFGG